MSFIAKQQEEEEECDKKSICVCQLAPINNDNDDNDDDNDEKVGDNMMAG